MNDNLFIRHPYLAIVFAIVITLCGSIALINLPISQFPPIAPPQVSITATYPGADAMTLLKTVVEPLENELNGVPDMIYIDSTSSESGEAEITVTFKIGSDPANNRDNVQNRANWAMAMLPDAVQKEGIIIQEKSDSILLAISIYSENNEYDSVFMGNYAKINLRENLERINGVSQVMITGSSMYSMRVWIDPDKCAYLNITPSEIISALESQNIQISAGSVGSSPAPAEQLFSYNINTKGRLKTVKDFENIIVRAVDGSAILYLKDVAKIELGKQDYTTLGRINGTEAAMMLIFQNSGYNGIAISDSCRKIMAEQSKKFPPGLKYGFQYDSTEFVRMGINDVIKTLLIAICLVAFITYIFLQNWRMVLVPILAIPVSIAGSFAVLFVLGYSINMITLFALTLAIGIVVDDAIIVIENVSRLIEEEHLSPKEAAAKSMKEITGAIIGTTAVLLAIFIPVTFFTGITGEFYRQFGITLSTAVILSAFNALTLSPALSALILKENMKTIKFAPFRWFNNSFNAISSNGAKVLDKLISLSGVIVFLYLLFALVVIYFFVNVPKGFIPTEDQGYFMGLIELPAGSSLERTSKVSANAEKVLSSIPGVKNVIEIPGFNMMAGTPQSDISMVIAILDPWKERIPKNLGANKIINMSRGKIFENIYEAFPMIFPPPPISGIGSSGGFNFVLQELGSNDPNVLAQELDKLLFAAMQSPKLQNVFSAFSADTPVIYLDIDRTKALSLGVSLNAINETLENYLGYTFINQFNRFSLVYKVELQAKDNSRLNPQDILNLYVKGSGENMVPLSAIGKITFQNTAAYLNRHNLRLSANIQGSPAKGYSSGEAMSEMEKIADSILGENMAYEWTEMSYQEVKSGKSVIWVFVLAIIFVYLFLVALYDSWILPWAVIPAIIATLAGALVALIINDLDQNIYTQIGILLLFGMACKTAILIVSFAKKNHKNGQNEKDAAISAAKLRFRAISMTSFAFIFGTLPLALSNGVGAESQRSIGVPVVGGMIAGVIGAMLIIPVCYEFMQKISDWFIKEEKKVEKMLKIFIIISILLVLNGCYSPPEKGRVVELKSVEMEQIQTSKPKQSPKENEFFTIEKAREIALVNNPTYLAAFAGVNAAKMRYFQAIGAYSPTISASATIGQELYDQTGSESSMRGEGNALIATASVGLNWVIFDGLEREFKLLISQHNQQISKLLCENGRRLLISSVDHSYRAVQSAKAKCMIAKANIKYQEEQLRQEKIKYKTGSVGIGDILNLEGELNQAKLNYLDCQNKFELAKFALAEVIGLENGILPEFVVLNSQMTYNYQTELLSLETYLDNSLSNRPDLNALREKLIIKKYNYYKTYSAFSPVFNAFANYTYTDDNSYVGAGKLQSVLLRGSTFNYGIDGSLDLFDGFIRYNTLRENKALLDQAYLQGAKEWLEVVNQVRVAYVNVIYNRKRLRIAERNMNIRRQERDIITKSYKVGEVDVIRLNLAQDYYIKSENEYVDAKISLDNAFSNLLTVASMN